MNAQSRSFRVAISGVVLIALFGTYVFTNWGKVALTQKYINASLEGGPVQTLMITHKSHMLVRFDLPTSDFVDRTGSKRVHFRYLSEEVWGEIKSKLASSQYALNNEKVKAKTKVFDTFAMIVLNHYKVYMIAPPYSEVFAKIVQFEKTNRKDIFSCAGNQTFCQSVRIVDFGGVTGIKERVLEQDAAINTLVLPRGRWAGNTVQLKIRSSENQAVQIRYKMDIPFESQKAMVLEPSGAKIDLWNASQEHAIQGLGKAMRPFDVTVNAMLKKGDNIVSVAFSKLQKKNANIRIEMAGVIKAIELAEGKSNALPFSD